ncbi:MAG: ABC transporter substrate-binding protein [Roseovarius sp.]
MTNDASRRHVVLSALALAGATLVPMPARALTEDRARTLVDRVVREINRAIDSSGSQAAMIREFERIFAQHADVGIIARSTLGADARRVSNAQMQAFTDAFRSYITRKYGKRFDEFRGGRIEVNSVREVKSWHEVRSTAYLPGQSPFEVRFLVSDRSGQDRFFDMVIEGISLRLSEREEIGAMLDQRNGDIDALIRDLRNAG